MDFKEQLTTWRHYLHQHPETAFEEHVAPRLVADEMRKAGIDVVEGVGKTGVVGTLRCGEGNVDGSCEPWMASEDFAAFLQHVPGCFLMLGSGRQATGNVSLHQNIFDYNDDVLELGARFWAKLAQQRLAK